MSARRPLRSRVSAAALAIGLCAGAATGCGGDGSPTAIGGSVTTGNPNATTVVGSVAPGSTIAPVAPDILLSPQGNNLDAYATTPPFSHQRVNRANKAVAPDQPDPDGWDINGQICAFRDPTSGTVRLITGEDTGQPETTAGFGVFDLVGSPGSFSVTRVGKLTPTYQPTPDGPDNFGCGVLSDGRVVTTDIGNNQSGEANGQLILWFPPYDSTDVAYCKLDLEIATGQSIAVDEQDRIHVVSPRPDSRPEATASGVFRYDGPFPTSHDAAGGCGRVDDLGSPLADSVRKQRVLASGEHGMVAPSGVAQRRRDGHWFVSSVINGVIAEYDADWAFVQTVLQPPAGETLGTEPFSTGTPLGVAVGADGTLYYADIGIVVDGSGIGPGDRTGSVRRITFREGAPNAPETIAADLAFPDGLGLYPPR